MARLNATRAVARQRVAIIDSHPGRLTSAPKIGLTGRPSLTSVRRSFMNLRIVVAGTMVTAEVCHRIQGGESE